MCLHIKSSFVAEKHIFAYKVGKRQDERILTCFRESLLSFNRLVTDRNFDKVHHSCLCLVIDYNIFPTYVDCGYFHAFTSSVRAKTCVTNIKGIENSYDLENNYNLYDYFLVIIPKGSVGFYGRDNDICANKMIFLHPEVPGFKEICSQYGITDDEYHKLLSS